MAFKAAVMRVLARLDWKKSDLARELGITPQALNSILSKDNPRQTTIAKLAAAMRTEPEELIRGRKQSGKVPAGWVKVPVIGRVPAGIPLEAIEEHDGEMIVPAKQFKTDRMFGLRVVGDSMTPDFRDGDAVLVDREAQVNNGDVVVMRVNLHGEVTLKRFYRTEQVITLQPANPSFSPISFVESDQAADIKILGKVVALFRDRF